MQHATGMRMGKKPNERQSAEEEKKWNSILKQDLAKAQSEPGPELNRCRQCNATVFSTLFALPWCQDGGRYGREELSLFKENKSRSQI